MNILSNNTAANIAIIINEIAALYVSGESLYVRLKNSDNSAFLGRVDDLRTFIITENNKQEIPVTRLITYFADYIAGYKQEPSKSILDDFLTKLPLEQGEA